MKKIILLAAILSFAMNVSAADDAANNKVEQLKQLLIEVPQSLATSNSTQVLVGNESNTQQRDYEQLMQAAKSLSLMLDNLKTPVTTNAIPGLKWQQTDISSVPVNSLYNAGDATQSVNICRTTFIGNHAYGSAVYPGMLSSRGCYISYAGYAFTFSTFQVLTGNNAEVRWVKFSVVANAMKEMNERDNKIKPMNSASPNNMIDYLPLNPQKQYDDVVIDKGRPVIGGYDNGSTVIICRATYQGKLHTGKLVGNACDISIGDKEVVVSKDFELMFYGAAKPANSA